MKNQQLNRVLTFAILAALVLVAPVGAQMTGRVVGTVVDDGDHSISGMSVRATDLLDGSKVYFATSDSDGGFVISDLAVGTYVVAAETANTQWVQKHDSPVVKVSADPATVTLTLVSLAQLQGDSSSGGGSPIGGITLAAAIIGAGAGTYAAINSQDAKDEAAAAKEAADRAKLAADQAKQANQDSANDLNNRIDGLSDQLDDTNGRLSGLEGAIYDINGRLIGLNGQLFDLQNDIDDIQDDVTDILDTLY